MVNPYRIPAKVEPAPPRVRNNVAQAREDIPPGARVSYCDHVLGAYWKIADVDNPSRVKAIERIKEGEYVVFYLDGSLPFLKKFKLNGNK